MAESDKLLKPKHPGGRPTDYNQEIADLICHRVATHDCGLQKLCEMYDDMPAKITIRAWKLKYDEFNTQYIKAKHFQVENLAEDILDLADESSGDIKYDKDGNESLNGEYVARSRLRIDTRKWLASKLAPKIYGDKKIDEAVSNNDALNKIKELVADLNKSNPSDI